MWSTAWPILLVIASNVIYHMISKSTPAGVNPFLSLVITYLVGAGAAALLYLVSSGQQSLGESLSQLNWTSGVLGIAIVGLEAGFLYAYRAGWGLSTASLTANLSVALILLVIGALCWHEGLGMRQLIGMALCVAGLLLVNLP